MSADIDYIAFYNRQWLEKKYGWWKTPIEHPLYEPLKAFIDKYQLRDKYCLEIGCGNGIFQDMVENYVGVDISASVRSCMHKPFYQSSTTQLLFKDNEFDAIWTLYTLEHIHEPEKALEEMRRVLKHNGLLFLAPAWHCRPWFSKGYSIRSYSDCSLRGKLIKISISIRNSRIFRYVFIFPGRIRNLLEWRLFHHPLNYSYRKLEPNYDNFIMPDSDATNSLDQHATILWFVSRGDKCITYPKWCSQLFARTGLTKEIVFQIKKR